jgi:hypothetical protein
LSETIRTSLENYVQYFKNYRREVIEAEARKIEELRLIEEQRIEDSIAQDQAEQRARYLRWRQQQQQEQQTEE